MIVRFISCSFRVPTARCDRYRPPCGQAANNGPKQRHKRAKAASNFR
jgi:hypothetical protein